MCTVTIIPSDAGFRFVINRDELRTRPPALRPAVVELPSGERAAWPTDALAGGTWIAAGTSGLVVGVLNGNPRPMPPMPHSSELTSRGMIVPALVECEGARDAVDRLESFSLERFAPFRVVAADRSYVVDAFWDRQRLHVTRRPLSPVCFVSSGLGDERVLPRVELWRSLIDAAGPTPATQDAFHLHRWPDRPELSVMMCRADARTVSVTRVEVGSPGVSMSYTDDSGTVRQHLSRDHASQEARVVVPRHAPRSGPVPC